jgi:hypothetical protein
MCSLSTTIIGTDPPARARGGPGDTRRPGTSQDRAQHPRPQQPNRPAPPEANLSPFGDSGRARQALQRARDTAETLPEGYTSSRSVWSFPTGRQAIFELSVAIHTGDPDSALRAAAMADSAWASGGPKDPANWAQIQAGSSIAYLMKDSLDEAAYRVAPVLDLPRELRISTVIGYLRKLESLLAQPRFAGNCTATELAYQIRDFISVPSPGMDAKEAR